MVTEQPRVVVTVIVDQLASWIAAERWPLLPSDGGFARLLREGTYATDMRFGHATTFTPQGHATLFSGATPRAIGLLGEDTPDKNGKPISFFADENHKLLPAHGDPKARGASLARANHSVTMLADQLRMQEPAAFMVALSLKDRGAMFAAGVNHRADACIWFDPEDQQLVTSTVHGDTFPAWARSLGTRDAIQNRVRASWEPLDGRWLETHSGVKDDAPGEGDLAGFGVTFPHVIASTKTPGKAFRTSPASDELLFELGLAALSLPEARKAPRTWLSISLSANDYIGHVFGPNSWESWDELARLDVSLKQFLDQLDGLWGRDGYAFVLTADHGIVPLPELKHRPWCSGETPDRWQRPCQGGGRLIPYALELKLNRIAQGILGQGSWLVGVLEPFVVLSQAALALPPEKLNRLVIALTKALSQEAGVERVIDVERLPSVCPALADESLEALVCRGAVPGMGARLYIVTKPGYFFDTGYTPTGGTSHGSPYLYDRSVPLVARAKGRVPAGAVLDQSLPFAAFAHTTAALLGIKPPPTAEPGPSLTSLSRK